MAADESLMTGDSFAPKTPQFVQASGNTLRSVGTSPAVVRHISTSPHPAAFSLIWMSLNSCPSCPNWQMEECGGTVRIADRSRHTARIIISYLLGVTPAFLHRRSRASLQPMCSIEAFKAAEDPYFCFFPHPVH